MVNLFNTPLAKAAETLKGKRIPHKKYEESVEKIASGIFVSSPGEVVCIVGPSRVGKTTAAYEACRQLIPENELIHDSDMPIVRVRLRNSLNGGRFDSVLFIRSALVAIKHPIFGVVESVDPFGIEFDKQTSRISESRLFEFFARAVIARNTKYLIIDEVQHLKYAIKGEEGAAAILDSWKAFAEETGVILILIGTYPILDILTLSAHMLGRTDNVEFERYKRNKVDIEQFQLILNTLDSIVPFSEGKLSEQNQFLYEGAYGCLGLLLRWLRGAIGHALALGKSEISMSDLRAHLKRQDDLASIRLEIDRGEDAIARGPTQVEKQSANLKEKSQKKRKPPPFQSKPRNYKQNIR
ncbi:MAG: hypothetical protein C0631_16575 [Sedimenticola sp.]|nr:MAG: hypothetical protein C0631_16575 [Sedimenticola sp.]